MFCDNYEYFSNCINVESVPEWSVCHVLGASQDQFQFPYCIIIYSTFTLVIAPVCSQSWADKMQMETKMLKQKLKKNV